MQKIFSERLNAFLGGASIGGITGYSWLLADATLWGHIVVYGLKLCGTIGIAMVTGIASSFAPDVAKFIKRKVFGKEDK
jgi:hypothetical protein